MSFITLKHLFLFNNHDVVISNFLISGFGILTIMSILLNYIEPIKNNKKIKIILNEDDNTSFLKYLSALDYKKFLIFAIYTGSLFGMFSFLVILYLNKEEVVFDFLIKFFDFIIKIYAN